MRLQAMERFGVSIPGCDEAGPLIRETFRAMIQAVEHHFGSSDLALSQWLTLKLARDGKIRLMGDVDRELGMTSGASTRLVDQLVARGLLQRTRSERDRRSVSIALTPAGLRIIEEMQPHILTFWEDRLEIFTPAELAKLFELLARLRDTLIGYDRSPGSAAPNRQG